MVGVTVVLDRNPKFGADSSFEQGARRVTDFLWEMAEGNPQAFPQSYLENLRHSYEDGRVSMLEIIDRIELEPNATYEEYCEVVDILLSADPARWPHPEDIIETPCCQLKFFIEPEEVDFSEFDFLNGTNFAEAPEGDALSDKVELFFKKVISSVYMDGVTEVTDAEGNPPNEANNYLMNPEGTAFSGIFYDSPPNKEAKKFPFLLKQGSDGSWQIKY